MQESVIRRGRQPRRGPPDGLTTTQIGMWQAFRNGSVYDLNSGDTSSTIRTAAIPGALSAPYGPASCAGCSWTAPPRSTGA